MTFWKCVVVTMLVTNAASVCALEDNFDGSELSFWWEVVTVGDGPTVSVGGGELLVTIPATSTGGGSWGNTGSPWISTGVRATCEVVGDFDFSVEFVLVDWPALNGVRAGIGWLNGVSGADGVVSRYNIGPPGGAVEPDYFAVHANEGPINVATTDESGRLRVVRVGSSWTGYYDVGGGWVEIGTVLGPTDPIRPEIRLWCHPESFGGEDVSVAFDNFVLSVGDGCEGVVSVDEIGFGSLKARFRE